MVTLRHFSATSIFSKSLYLSIFSRNEWIVFYITNTSQYLIYQFMYTYFERFHPGQSAEA